MTEYYTHVNGNKSVIIKARTPKESAEKAIGKTVVRIKREEAERIKNDVIECYINKYKPSYFYTIKTA